jgi:DNA-directed RNA polymerases I and III subunit RPAC1
VDSFLSNFDIQVIERADDHMIFDVIGIEAPIANAFRRILLGEIPTMAIETVIIEDNTSVIHDEMLAHRLGLIPIKVDPEFFDLVSEPDCLNGKNSLKFRLDVTCRMRAGVDPDAPEEELWEHGKVYARDLVYVPDEDADDRVKELGDIRPVIDDIVIAELRGGQRIVLEAVCTKGEGKEHSKWSPVSTATYRLMPDIHVSEDLSIEEADELIGLCPLQVFEKSKDGKVIAKKARKCTMCRECLRHPNLGPKVKISRWKDHFIFMIESVGQIPAPELFHRAVQKLLQKSLSLKAELTRTRVGPGPGDLSGGGMDVEGETTQQQEGEGEEDQEGDTQDMLEMVDDKGGEADRDDDEE